MEINKSIHQGMKSEELERTKSINKDEPVDNKMTFSGLDRDPLPVEQRAPELVVEPHVEAQHVQVPAQPVVDLLDSAAPGRDAVTVVAFDQAKVLLDDLPPRRDLLRLVLAHAARRAAPLGWPPRRRLRLLTAR